MKENRFRVAIENVGQLFKLFSAANGTYLSKMLGGSIFQLGFTQLKDPATEVEASAYSDGKQLILSAVVRSAFKPGGRIGYYKLIPPHKQLSQCFKIKKVSKIVFVLDDGGREEFVVRRDSPEFGFGCECLKVEAGGQGGLRGIRCPPKPITTVEQFEKDILKFARIIEVAVNGVYEDFRREAPEVTLYLKPPVLMANETGEKIKRTNGERSALEIEKPNVSFEDIGGNEAAKREMQGLSFALKRPELYGKWGTKPPRGIILCGPPGTGKTLMAKALATEAKARFYHVKVADISSMWYGQSEKLMQSVFDTAKETAPSIIFFDEVDAIAPQRDRSHEATQRVIATLLENLDGMEVCDNIMVVASTNRLEVVDSALKRPGRIDRWVEVFLPDTEGRKKIFAVHSAKAERTAGRQIFKEVDWNLIAVQTDKMSGADIAEIIRRTLEEKVRKEGIGEEPGVVTTEDIAKEIRSYERFKEITKKLGFQTSAKDS